VNFDVAICDSRSGLVILPDEVTDCGKRSAVSLPVQEHFNVHELPMPHLTVRGFIAFGEIEVSSSDVGFEASPVRWTENQPIPKVVSEELIAAFLVACKKRKS
jgi:hypothetical protein